MKVGDIANSLQTGVATQCNSLKCPLFSGHNCPTVADHIQVLAVRLPFKVSQLHFWGSILDGR